MQLFLGQVLSVNSLIIKQFACSVSDPFYVQSVCLSFQDVKL